MRPNQFAALSAAQRACPGLGRPLLLAVAAAFGAAGLAYAGTDSLALAFAAYCVAGSVGLIGFAALLNR